MVFPLVGSPVRVGLAKCLSTSYVISDIIVFHDDDDDDHQHRNMCDSVKTLFSTPPATGPH